MPDLSELIRRIGGKALLPQIQQPPPSIRKHPALQTAEMPNYAGNLPVITQTPQQHSPSNASLVRSDLPIPTLPQIGEKPRFEMPQIIPVASDAKATALPETGRPGALENLPVPIPQFNAPLPNLDEPPPTAANGIGGNDFKQQLGKIVLGALHQIPKPNTTPELQDPTAQRPRIVPNLPVINSPTNPSDLSVNESAFKPENLPLESKIRLSRSVIPSVQNTPTQPTPEQPAPEQLTRPRTVPNQPINPELPQTQTAEANPREATIDDFFGNIEQLIRERADYSKLKGKDLDANHDSKMTNFLKGLLNGVRVWSQNGGQGGVAGLLGAVGAGGIANVASPHMDERIELQDKIKDYDRQIEGGFNNLDKLTQLDARRATTDYTRQRSIIETKKEEGRNARAETVSNDKALSRQQRQTEFESRLNAKLERERKTDSQVRYIEAPDGRGFLIDKYGKRTPAIDDATGKQFQNPYKQPFELDFGDGEKLTVPQSQAATIKSSIKAKRFEADYRNAMEEYETKESNEALSAAIEAKKGEVQSYEGMLESLRFVNSKLYDDFNDSKQRLESFKDRPDDDPDKVEALSAFRRANSAVKQNERDITEFEEKAVAGNRDLTELNGKFKSAPPKKQAPETRVSPRKMPNNGKYSGQVFPSPEAIQGAFPGKSPAEVRRIVENNGGKFQK